MKTFYSLVLTVTLLIVLDGCNNNPTETNTNLTEVDQTNVSSFENEDIVYLKLKGRIDFSNGTYFESYDKERIFTLQASKYLREDEILPAQAQPGGCCVNNFSIMSGQFTISGMTTVIFTLAPFQDVGCTGEGTTFSFHPRVLLKGTHGGVMNSKIKLLGSSTSYYSGNTDFDVNSSSQWQVITGRESNTFSIGLHQDLLSLLEITIFNDQPGTIEGKQATIVWRRCEEF